MANMIKDLLAPSQAKLLDDQLRRRQLQEGVTNYGSDPLGKFLTAASGAQRASAGVGMAAERVLGGRQMGMNEAAAVQRQEQLKQQKEKQDKELNMVKQMAKDGVTDSSLPEAQKAAILGNIDKDPTGKYATAVLNKYGMPSLPEGANVKLAELAKEFTGESVAEFGRTNDPAVLVQRNKDKPSNYVVMSSVVGYDNNGQPITENLLVDKEQVGSLTNNAAVIDVKDLSGKSMVTDNVNKPVKPPEQSEEEKQQVVRLVGTAGMSLKDAQELRAKTERDMIEIKNLFNMLNNPSASNVLGLAKLPNRKAQEFLETEEGVLSRSFEMNAIQGAIQSAKLLGVNPTDKDFQKSLESRPNMNDGVETWRKWAKDSMLPAIVSDMRSKFPTDDKRAQQLISVVETIANDISKTSQKPVNQKTSTGTSYTIIE
jgi:hypothetical protein